MFEGKDVLELGAGCGLSGLVASRCDASGLRGGRLGGTPPSCGCLSCTAGRFARRTLLTDGHETVVELLERNAERQREQHGVSVRASQLEWGCSPEELQAALRYEDEEGERLQGSRCGGQSSSCEYEALSCSDKGECLCVRLSSSFRPQVLLGADVVCWPDAVVPFVQTVRALLLQAPDPGSAALYLGLVVRATSTERLFRQALSEHGLTLRPIEPSAFLPDPRPDNTVSNMQLHLLVVQMAADPRATAQGEQEQSKS